MQVHAIVHTTGVSAGGRYHPLELAYLDTSGTSLHFLINSPVTFGEYRKMFPNAMLPDAVMTKSGATSLLQVQTCLRKKFKDLCELHGPIVCFGYKGTRDQARVLIDAGIPNVVNLESLGVPSFQSLAVSCTEPSIVCPWHKTPKARCAKEAVRLLSSFRK